MVPHTILGFSVRSCSCYACSHGCRMGSPIVLLKDVEALAAFFGISTSEFLEKYAEAFPLSDHIYKFKSSSSEKAYGPCRFFKEGKCLVHTAKPLQCQLTLNCADDAQKRQRSFLQHFVD